MSRLIPLTSAEIHLWLAFYDAIAEERVRFSYRELLGEAEREQELRFYSAKDRLRYLTTRALVRTVLSRYVSIHPREWVFSTNAYGRPGIVNAPARDACLSLSISHTDSLIVLGLSKRRAIGVDVENFLVREVSMDIAERFFAPEEVAALRAVPPCRQQYRFFEYWTFKEAYVKARGMGLSLPFDKIAFHYPGDQGVEVTIDPALADDSARWQFWQFQPRSQYLVAVCAECAEGPSPNLVLRQAIPMLEEEEVAVEVLRSSKRIN